MIDKIIGFIGAGNMGSAMIGGIIHSELVTTSQIIASAHSAATLEKLQSTYSIETTLSNETVAERSDILFLAVKPNKFDEVIPQISSHVKSGCVIVSIAAGKTIAAIEDSFGKPVKLVRAMPNTPALVGEAMSALCVNQNVTPEELKEVQALFNSFGKSSSGFPVLLQLMYTCLSKLWRMPLSQMGCRGHRPINLPPSLSMAPRKWFWKPESTRAN